MNVIRIIIVVTFYGFVNEIFGILKREKGDGR